MITEWFEKLRLIINVNKSVETFFNKKLTDNLPTIKWTGNNIEWKNEVKYTGVTSNKTLTFGNYIKSIVFKAKRIKGILYPMLYKKSYIPFKTKILIPI